MMANIRPLSILAAYLTIGLTIPIFLLSSLAGQIRKSPPLPPGAQVRIAIFSCLAVGSLGSTWYHMFRFFVHSYKEWASVNEVPLPTSGFLGEDGIIYINNAHWRLNLLLGEWLRDTQLFRQAWETVITGSARWWWSQQIFLITTGWSIYLGRTGEDLIHLWSGPSKI